MKKMNIIEKFRSLIAKKYRQIEENFQEACAMSKELSLIKDNLFKDADMEDLTVLSRIDDETFDQLLKILTKDEEDSLRTTLKASKFLMANNIGLVDDQKDKIRDFIDRANLRKTRLERKVESSQASLDNLELYNKVEQKLIALQDSGYIDNETLNEVCALLKVTEEKKETYIDEALSFNVERYKKQSTKTLKEEPKVEETPKELPATAITKEELASIFEKHHYDMANLSDEMVNLLMMNGDLIKIDSIFTSIERNKLDFLTEDKKNAAILTKFLLQSSSELIDEGCKLFKDEGVSADLLKSYKAIFFETSDTQKSNISDQRKKRNKGPADDSTSPISPLDRLLSVNGRNKDFKRNLELLESLGRDKKKLLETQVYLLTSPHKCLLRHIDELKLYEYPIDDKAFPLSAISSFRIMELTDKYIELGEEEYIHRYASKLTSHIDGIFERMYAMKKEGIPIHSEKNPQNIRTIVFDLNKPCEVAEDRIKELIPKDSETLLKGNKYNQLLEDYAPSTISPETLDDPVIKKLDENYKYSNLGYNFNGVIISRKKLLRNYEFLMKTDLIPAEEKDQHQMLFVASLYNSWLDMDQIEKIEGAISASMSLGGNNDVLKK